MDGRLVALHSPPADGERPALLLPDRAVTWGDLDSATGAAAEQIGRGRRLVVIAADTSVGTISTYRACRGAGHVALLAPPCRAEALAERYDADTIATPNGITHRHDDPAHTLHPDLAVLLSTSGSTGSPKLVRLSHHNLDSNAAAVVQTLGLSPSDRTITTLSPAYSYGLSVINSHLLVGASLVVTDLSVTDDGFWHLARDRGVTTLPGVPYSFDLLQRRGFTGAEIPSLRLLTCAGGGLAPALARHFAELGERHGWQLALMYGATEATARMACLPPDLTTRHPDTVGRAIPGGSFRLTDVDAEGIGDLHYRGPNVMMGYARTAADLASGATVEELATGDRARIRPDGLVQIVGRRDDYAKVFGLRISLSEVEGALSAVGFTARCVARSQQLSVVVESDAAGAVRKTAALASGLPAHAIRVHPVEALPRGANGKIQRDAVERLAAQDLAPAIPTTGTPVERLCTAYATILGRPVGKQDTFAALGGDSLSYVAVSVAIEEVLGELPRDWHRRTIADLAGSALGRRRPCRHLETSVVLRALAIVLIVGSHAGAMDIRGGAHALIALVGYNFARFQLAESDLSDRLRRMGRAAAGALIPGLLWVAVLAAMTTTYSWAVVGVNWIASPTTDSPDWRYWFVEALLWLLPAVALGLRVPAVERLRQRYPFGLPAAAAVVLWSLAQVVVPDARPSSLFAPLAVAWLLLLGWAIAAASGSRQRWILTGLIVALTASSFEESRLVVIPAMLLALVWVPGFRLPRRLTLVMALVAEASLLIFLSHWQVLEVLDGWTALAVSLVVGIALHRGYVLARRWGRVHPVVAVPRVAARRRVAAA